jgi:hypothetical protein
MKYIMFQTEDGRKIPIIFPNFMVHSMVAERLKDIVSAMDSNPKIVSAGEIKLTVQNCNGKSDTLKVGVRKGDAKLIHEYDYFHGFPNETGVEIP